MWDTFISHASEDKAGFVRPLADALRDYGLSVWYDEFSLSVGDSLSRSIDKGLAKSKFGIVVLSPAFLKKDWPEYELRGLTAREVGAGKVILPVWYGLTREQLLEYSPTLADKLAIDASKKTVDEVALQLVEAIRPDLFTRIHRRLLWEEHLRTKTPVKTDVRTIRQSPPRHKELSPELVGRIRLVRAALWGVHTHSMDVWVDGFKRDLHPEKEVGWWEHLAACHLEFIKSRKLSSSQIDLAFAVLFWLGNGEAPDSLQASGKKLGAKNFKLLCDLPRYRYPILDVEEKLPEERMTLPPDVEIRINAVSIDDVRLRPDDAS